MAELVDLLGKTVDSVEVAEGTRSFSLNEVMADPPSRNYLISRNQGIDLLFEDGRVVAVQIFVQPTRKFSAFSGTLPMGLKSGMTQTDVHQVLGAPLESDEYDSMFVLADRSAKLVVTFDDSANIKYLSLELA